MNAALQEPTRRAILIASPGQGSEYLRGVEKDVEAMQNFLLSANGGKWKKKEIAALYDPNINKVIKEVHQTQADYCLVYYAGHGFQTASGNRKIELIDSAIEDKLLLNQCPRQILIFDTCRNIVPHAIGAVPDEFLPFDGFYPEREAFNKFILQSPPGKVIIHSTKSNLPASECLFGSGGFFTQELVASAKAIKCDELYSPISIEKLLCETKTSLKKSGVFQEPEVVYSEGNVQVPLAIYLGVKSVVVPKLITKPVQRIRSQRTEDYSGLVAASLLLIAFAAISD
jgi:hypothetical protein